MKSLGTMVFALACAAAAFAPLLASAPRAAAPDGFPGWPARFEGVPITQLALSPVEQRFGQNFPGHVGRFTDGRREIILRWVAEGSRKLHPASDCFKANGYAVAALPITVNGGERWSGFTAARGKQQYEVRERIVDAAGRQWSDVSAWYWALQLGQTNGPWWAMTVARTVKN